MACMRMLVLSLTMCAQTWTAETTHLRFLMSCYDDHKGVGNNAKRPAVVSSRELVMSNVAQASNNEAKVPPEFSVWLVNHTGP